MTKRRDLKKLIRERQAKTGEAYTAARLQVLETIARKRRVSIAASAIVCRHLTIGSVRGCAGRRQETNGAAGLGIGADT